MTPTHLLTGKMGNFQALAPKKVSWPCSAAKSSKMDRPWRASSSPLPPPPPPRTTTPPRRDSGVGASSNNWREKMGCLPGINKPSFNDLKPGMVFLLPGDQEVIDAMANSGLEETDRPWEHPAVVTWKFEMNGEEYVKFRTCTTFDPRSVVEAKPEHQRALFLLAENKEDVTPHWGTSLGKITSGS